MIPAEAGLPSESQDSLSGTTTKKTQTNQHQHPHVQWHLPSPEASEPSRQSCVAAVFRNRHRGTQNLLGIMNQAGGGVRVKTEEENS